MRAVGRTMVARSRRRLPRPTAVIRLAIVVVFAAVCVFPLYWMIISALNRSTDAFAFPPRFLPRLENLESFRLAFKTTPILRWLSTTTIVAAGITVLSLLMGTLCGYALSRFKFRGRSAIGVLLFSTQMLPETLVIVPLYTVFVTLGLLNNLVSLIIANTAFVMPIVAWIVKSAVDAVPYELEEAARVDGCSRLMVLQIIVTPLILPSIAAASVIAFFYGWNEFLFAATFVTERDMWTASVGLASLVNPNQTPVNVVYAMGVLYTLPAVLFYLVAQRRIIAGLTAGAVKG